MFALCDSDHASSDLERDECKSRSGFVIFVYGGAVMWYSKMQSITATSSSYAEYIAMFETTQRVNYIVDVLGTVSQYDKKPAPLFNDNNSANSVVKSEQLTSQSKFFRIKYHAMKQYVGDTIDPMHISTHENLADVLTKPLGRVKHEQLSSRIMNPKLFKFDELLAAAKEFSRTH
jgi:hypothetical protein